MAEVTLHNIFKSYPGVERAAVRDVSLEAKDGEFLVLVGPSGCGKSTTLRMIAGLERATQGDIVIGGRRVNDVAPKDRDIAMIFQNYALYPHMNVYQNMAFPLKMRKAPRAEIDTRVRETARMLGLSEYLDRKPRALSGGQRQRVALGRAIVRRPQVFLFDEPLSNLDAKMRVVMRSEISDLHRRLGATMIYVTHDQVEAMTLGDRIVVMKDGEVQQIADPRTVYDQPANMFVAGFIGSPPMNFVRGRLESASESDSRRFVGPGVAFEAPASVAPAHLPAGAEIVWGVRPESFSLAPREARASAALTGRVTHLEALGAETIFYMDVEGAPLIARLEPEARAQIGSTVTLHADLARALFFDPATEKLIAISSAP